MCRFYNQRDNQWTIYFHEDFKRLRRITAQNQRNKLQGGIPLEQRSSCSGFSYFPPIPQGEKPPKLQLPYTHTHTDTHTDQHLPHLHPSPSPLPSGDHPLNLIPWSTPDLEGGKTWRTQKRTDSHQQLISSPHVLWIQMYGNSKM